MGNAACITNTVKIHPDKPTKTTIYEPPKSTIWQLSSSSRTSGANSRDKLKRGSLRSTPCLLFLERLQNISGYVSVRAWVTDADCAQVGDVVEWPCRGCDVSPAWFSARDLGIGFKQKVGATLHIAIANDKAPVGSISIPWEELAFNSSMSYRLSKPYCTKEVQIDFQVVQADAVMEQRTVFFIRHAQSSWNRAKARMRLHDMARTTDHPISQNGQEQADMLAKRIAAISKEDQLALPMLSPDVVYTSPLSRAVQTSAIALQPLFAQADGPKELVLMPSAREKQNVGGLDTRSRKLGKDILQHNCKQLGMLYKGKSSEVVDTFKDLQFDIREVEDRWWCEEVSESTAQLGVRMEDFLAQVLYSPHKVIIIVGHSHFFRAFCQRYLHDQFRELYPQLAKSFCARKLKNCTVARLELDPAQGLYGKALVHVSPVLGSPVMRPSDPQASPSISSEGESENTDSDIKIEPCFPEPEE